MKSPSRIVWIVCCVMLVASQAYLPRWVNSNFLATISWDVSGYYIYLPATFIYKDLKKVKFKHDIHEKYANASHTYQTFTHESGNEVAKYSAGLAVQYMPFFLIAHTLAEPLGYEADGYTLPYQCGVHWGGLLVAMIGLYFARKNLLEFFDDTTTAITLFLLFFGTNYWNYAAFDTAMTHNYLFTNYALLIWTTIQFYKSPDWRKALFIGFLVGLAALTRPTEIIAALIPLLWGLHDIHSFRERGTFLKKNGAKILGAAATCLAVGSIQLIYWKYVTGDWLVYSYEEEGFHWLAPHFKECFIGSRKGWFTYTPMMIFSVLGIFLLPKFKKRLFLPVFIVSILAIYITFSWHCWWYGGGIGQRAMVQHYALLLLPFATFVEQARKAKLPLKLIFGLLCGMFIYYNVWLMHNMHKTGIVKADGMTRAYLRKVIGRWNIEETDFKLLDTNEEFSGRKRKNLKRLYTNDFESDSTNYNCDIPLINGKNSFCITKHPQSPIGFFGTPHAPNGNRWIRVGGTFRYEKNEWTLWKSPQFIVRFLHNKKEVKVNKILIARLLAFQETQEIFIDVTVPKPPYNRVEILFWSDSEFPVRVDDLYIESFN